MIKDGGNVTDATGRRGVGCAKQEIIILAALKSRA
jgi:hypothetical protein